MKRSMLGGNKNGLGFYELMTAPEGIYLGALAAIEKNDFNKFFELLGVDKLNHLKGDTNGHNKSDVRADF
jgi:hypothetical protein